MHNIIPCPCCDSLDQTSIPAYMSQFVVWRTTGVKPKSNLRNLLIQCNHCNYYFSDTRFTDQELARLYTGYRGAEYNQMRIECEPTYQAVMYSDSYIKQRKEFIDRLIGQHIANIESVLDYGGDDGKYIPEMFATADRYVYDLSGADTIPGIKKYDPAQRQKFDLVMNCQVLEHVSDINQLIVNLKDLTNNYLYIEVPAYRKPPAIDIVVGEHLNFFRKSSLIALLNRHNIQIVDTAVDYDLQVLAVLGKI